MRRAVAFALMIGLAAMLAWAPAGSARAKTATVDVGDDFFLPADLKVKKDTTVDFNWVGENVHDVVKGDGPGKFFESGPLQGEGVLYSRKFRKAGRYEIICTLHEQMTMALKVQRKRRR